MCHYSTTSDPSPEPSRLAVLIGVSAAWHERDRIQRFLELKGYAEAAACLAVDYAEWRREEFARKERSK